MIKILPHNLSTNVTRKFLFFLFIITKDLLHLIQQKRGQFQNNLMQIQVVELMNKKFNESYPKFKKKCPTHLLLKLIALLPLLLVPVLQKVPLILKIQIQVNIMSIPNGMSKGILNIL